MKRAIILFTVYGAWYRFEEGKAKDPGLGQTEELTPPESLREYTYSKTSFQL
jgi:hypothetical protein